METATTLPDLLASLAALGRAMQENTRLERFGLEG